MNKISTIFFAFFTILAFTTLDSCKEPEPGTLDFSWLIACPSDFVQLDETKTITKICFGSCGAQTLPQPLLKTVADIKPDLYVFLGDNIYGDTEDMDVMRKEYRILCPKEEFIALKEASPIIAVWDDHDFGYNDAGMEYPKKEENKQVFMEFWGETDNTERMSHPGIYDAKIIGEAGKKVQIITLDTRTFRTSLKLYQGNPFAYEPNNDVNASMLGAEQWSWLEIQLLKPADLRIIVSSTQFAVEHNYFEAWANFPIEQNKMYDLIESTNASGVFFISGDVHYSELSKRSPSNTYPIYDLTSSGITGTATPDANTYREGSAFAENNIGMLDIDWDGDNTKIKMSIINQAQTVLLEKEITLSDIQF